MRIYKVREDIKYKDTREFFANRAEKYNVENPYSVTMYQDGNPDLVKRRNEKETEVLLPKLQLSKSSRILDIACGIGRWADAVNVDIDKYTGVDFSEELIEIARKRNQKENFSFYQGSAAELEKVIQKNEKEVAYNVVLVIGLQIYLNDSDMETLFQQICRLCDNGAIVCLREPVAINERLTLKEFYSEALKENYNAIYRTREEHMKIYDMVLEKEGFTLLEEGFLYQEETLNNRKETAQYYWIYRR